MGDMKQVKVDNWGTFFLQRLKHFFNRTDYCDLTLQFQDNAQLKVHRLVLNACTEYFELLERTCEMYEDCLIMPDDLQADVVVPIVNFMYTGQLEYPQELVNKLYQTAQIMNMTVLTKLLDAHRSQPKSAEPKYKQLNNQVSYSRSPQKKPQSTTSQKTSTSVTKTVSVTSPKLYDDVPRHAPKRKLPPLPARPTRYDIPEELETDNLFGNAFEDISYESKPLLVHPNNKYASKSSNYDDGPSTSKRVQSFTNNLKRCSTSNEVEFKKLKVNQEPQLFNDPDNETVETPRSQSASRHFDHVIEMDGAKVTIETKSGNEKPIDHAKIISEVLKKYPHLVKNNKNIKLKIVNTPGKSTANKTVTKTKQLSTPMSRNIKRECEKEYTYETAITDTKEVGRLISLGMENFKGPWLCLICGTPGKALNFPSYHKFHTHLVEVHNERSPSNLCQYCGFKSSKRNHLLHHIYTKHGVPPPPSYNFPKCNLCPYIALTQGFLVKHKLTHGDTARRFACNVCKMQFFNSSKLLAHIQQTGHKICPDRKATHQCIYCLKTFLRENNLYAHLKSNHMQLAKNDGIIDISDDDDDDDYDENESLVKTETNMDDYEQRTEEEYDDEDMEEDTEVKFQIHGGVMDSQMSKKTRPKLPDHKILNQSFSKSPAHEIRKSNTLNISKIHNIKHVSRNEPSTSANINETVVVLNQNDYILKDSSAEIVQEQPDEYILSDMINPDNSQNANIQITEQHVAESHIHHETQNFNTKQLPVNQPYQIVVSSEQEYKALMAANPSIIFQDGTDCKAMTVMTHRNAMTTGNIQLDASQNNMMIIPDNYPINVSQTLPVDSSNIVVVYSHNMEQHGMDYSEQLIANPNGQNQLVSSSQVITSMSSNPVQSTMIIGQPMEQWQSHDNIATLQPAEPLISHIEMQNQTETVIESNDTANLPTMIDKSMTESNEIQMIGHVEDIVNEEVVSQSSEVLQNTVIVDQSNANFQESEVFSNHDQDIISEIQNTPSEIVKDADVDALPSETTDNEELQEIVHQDSENLEENMESECSQELPETESSVTPASNEINEKIKSLASEWSDDETSKIAEEVNITQGSELTAEIVTEESAPTENSEVEESIENIEQEMKNQVSLPQSDKKITITSDIILPNSSSIITKGVSLLSDNTVQTNTVGTEPVDESTKNKITTLLHDWDNDESDSHKEENGHKTQTDDSVDDPDAGDTENTVAQSIDENLDKNKSLNTIISDWDDEEEKQE